MKALKRKIDKLRPYLSAILVWFAVWTVTQGLFINTAWLSLFSSDAVTAVVWVTIYFIAVMVIAAIIFRKQLHMIFPRQRYIWLYLLVVVAMVYVLATRDTVGVLPVPVYLFMIVTTVFWQDILTFGALQAKIERLNPRYGWLIVVLVFWLGHVVFDLPGIATNSLGALLVLIAAFSFAWLRKITKSFYVGNVLHLLSYLVLL